MKSIHILLITSLTSLAFPAGVYAANDVADMGMPGHEHHSSAAELTKEQTKFLTNYESVRAALAADNLDVAKRSAANIIESPAATQLSKASSLNDARVAFKKLSDQAVTLAKGQAGYYVANCPMVGSDWVQTTTKISNPYLGAKMSTCGTVKN